MSENMDKVKKYFSVEIKEEERQRIARDLHDSSLQTLTHCIHKIELASTYIDKDPIQAKLELATISKDIKGVIEEIRNTIFDLRPMQFDDLGLKEAVLQLIENVKRETKFSFLYEIADDIFCEDKDVLFEIYRIVQECINNAMKHSNGNLIVINIKQKDDYCLISVSDDGEGFNMYKLSREKKEHHFGLMILEERVHHINGEIDLYTEIGKGTRVKIKIPLK